MPRPNYPPPATAGHRGALLLLCSAVLIAQIDTSVVNLAVHAIGTSLHAPLPALQWVLDSYNLSYAALLMTGGTLADLLGRRRTLRAGAAVFLLGSLLAGLSPSIGWLIAGRVLAGIGAALLLSASLALIPAIWDAPQARAQATGVWAGTNGAAVAIGPTLGGWLIQSAGWHSAFLLTVPISAALWVGAPRALPESLGGQRRLDLKGQIFAGLALTSLAGAAIVPRYAPLGLAAALLSAWLFLRSEQRAGSGAMIPVALLRSRQLRSASGVAMAMTFGMYGVLFLLPLTWQRLGTLDVAQVGLALLPMSLTFVALSHRSGAWSGRLGRRQLIWEGMALIGSGILLLAFSRSGRLLGEDALGLVLTGAGMALSTGPLLDVAVSAAEPARSGTVSGVINTARMVGASLGVAVLGSLYAVQGFGAAMGAAAVVALAGSLLAWSTLPA
jgi:MFS family permease